MKADKAIINSKYHGTHIWGIDPTTGFPHCVVAFEPTPGRSCLLVISQDDWYYSPDAGRTWEVNPASVDMREVHITLSMDDLARQLEKRGS